MRFLRVLLDYLLVPGLILPASLLAALWWTNKFAGTLSPVRGFLAALWAVLVIAALTYQTGFKGYYKSGRKEYFYVVFAAPLLLAIMGVLYGALRLF